MWSLVFTPTRKAMSKYLVKIKALTSAPVGIHNNVAIYLFTGCLFYKLLSLAKSISHCKYDYYSINCHPSTENTKQYNRIIVQIKT